MTRKVEVGFVKYHPEDINEWDIHQISAMQQKAKDKLFCNEWGWEIDNDFNMELIDE